MGMARVLEGISVAPFGGWASFVAFAYPQFRFAPLWALLRRPFQGLRSTGKQ